MIGKSENLFLQELQNLLDAGVSPNTARRMVREKINPRPPRRRETTQKPVSAAFDFKSAAANDKD